jgi:hypothetical protein
LTKSFLIVNVEKTVEKIFDPKLPTYRLEVVLERFLENLAEFHRVPLSFAVPTFTHKKRPP